MEFHSGDGHAESDRGGRSISRTWGVLGGIGLMAGVLGPLVSGSASAGAAGSPEILPLPTPTPPAGHASELAWELWSINQQAAMENSQWTEIFSQDGCTLEQLSFVPAPADVAVAGAPPDISVTTGHFDFQCPPGVSPSVLKNAPGQGATTGQPPAGRAVLTAAHRGAPHRAKLEAFGLNGCAVVNGGIECGGVDLAGEGFAAYQYLGWDGVLGNVELSNDGLGSAGCFPGSFVAETPDVPLSYPQSLGVIVPITSSSTWDATFWAWTKSGYQDWGDVCGAN